jgi:sarcosine oxidase/L-pipecolate oxidase
MANVMSGEGNGDERDRAWRWKSETELQQRKGKEFGNSPNKRTRLEFSDFESERASKL